MDDESVQLFHRTRSSSSGCDEDVVFSGLPYTGSYALGSPKIRKGAGERGSYTALDRSSPSPGLFWLVVVQLVAQTLLATLIFLFILVFVDRRAFNVTDRRPYYQLANGTEARLPQKSWYPLQSDVTTIISGLFNLLGKCYGAWIATMTWNYAFLLLERNGMRLKSLSSMISLPVVPALFPPPGFETDPASPLHGGARKWRAFGIALTMLSVFPASFSPPIATGSISWHQSTLNVSNADAIDDIGGQGHKYGISEPWWSWCTDLGYRSHFIQRGSALAVHAWNSVSDIPDSAPTFKRVVPSVQSLPVGSSLNNITVPMFVIESFDWITDAADVSAVQLAFLAFNSTPGTLYSPTANTNQINPLYSPGVVALLPDAPFNTLDLTGGASSLPQPLMIQNKTGVVAISINYAGECDASTSAIFGPLPPNVFTSSTEDIWSFYYCFVFAKITYSAGAATCLNCEVVFPLVVQNPPGVNLTLQADEATQHALYVMADVIGEIANSNVTMPNLWNNIETYTKEVLVRGYSSAWTVMSEMLSFSKPLPSTYVTIPITTSQAFVDRPRLWGWLALQVLAFVGGVVFLVHIRSADRYPIKNPLMHGLMLDVKMGQSKNKELARTHAETWPSDFQGTFITWDRQESALTIQGDLKRAKDPLYRRIISYCFGLAESSVTTVTSAV